MKGPYVLDGDRLASTAVNSLEHLSKAPAYPTVSERHE
jgi:hypothetical protein